MFYSPKDLDALAKNLADCHRYVERGQDQYSPHLLTLLEARIKICEDILTELELNLSQLTPELTPKWDKLVSILRSLAGCNARSKVRNYVPPFDVSSDDGYSFLTTRSMIIMRS